MSRSGLLATDHVWKRFRSDMRHRRLAAHLRRLPQRLQGVRTQWFWALRDVSLEIEPGSAVGLIGANGSGKSTLLKILNRVMFPYAGSIETRGRIGALIEVTSGLHPELTGRENVGLYGSLLGLKRRDVDARFDDIVGFAELEHAIDRQLKFYSSGMRTRLGFSVAAFLEPDILLIDEVLAVGDARFQQRCLDRMSEVNSQGTTLVYVSHDLATVEAQCTRAIWLRDGVLSADGPVRDVVNAYRQAIEEQTAFSSRETIVQVTDVSARSVDDAPPRSGDPLEITLTLKSPEAMPCDVSIGISEGTANPIVLVSNPCFVERGATTIVCRWPTLPVPHGRYFLWLTVSHRTRQLVPWSPVLAVDVVGPKISPSPRGVVRMAPVFVDAEWKLP